MVEHHLSYAIFSVVMDAVCGAIKRNVQQLHTHNRTDITSEVD